MYINLCFNRFSHILQISERSIQKSYPTDQQFKKSWLRDMLLYVLVLGLWKYS